MRGGNSGESPMGTVQTFAGLRAPDGAIECNGQLLSIDDYPVLFNPIGTTYGGGGQATFRVPDLRGRSVLGAGAQGGITYDLGEQVRASGFTFNINDFGALNIVGTAAVDVRYGANQADTISGLAGNDALHGNGGDDILIGGGGRDTLDGGSGTDTASYAGAADGVIANLLKRHSNQGEATGGTCTSIESLTGSSFNDVLIGDGGSNRLDGGDLNDILSGGGGADALIGGAGSDNASYAGSGTGVTASLFNPAGNAGDAAGDSYSSIENLTGTNYADVLTGDANNNTLRGGSGADTLNGGDAAMC